MRRRLTAALLALVLIPAAAHARPPHHHHARHHHRVAHRRVLHHAGHRYRARHENASAGQSCDAWVQACDGPAKAKVAGFLRHRIPASVGNLVARARAHMGETARQLGLRRTEWCSAFLRWLTHASDVDDRAISWLHKRHVTAHVGAIAVMPHHVGIVEGFDRHGNPVIISGNHNNRVGEAVYQRRRIIAFVAAL